MIAGMNMPGAVAPLQQNNSFIPAPFPAPGMQGAAPAMPTAQPIWQPGQPLLPTQSSLGAFPAAPTMGQPFMPQFMPGAAFPAQEGEAQPQFQPQPQPLMSQPQVTAAPMPMQHFPSQFVTAQPFPAHFQQSWAPAPIIQTAPTVQASPLPANTGACETSIIEQVAAPAMSAFNPMLQQFSLPPQVISAPPLATYTQQNVSYLPPQVQTIQQSPSYIPAPVVQQSPSYIPAQAPITQTYAAPVQTFTAQPQVNSYMPAPQVIETVQPQVNSYIPAPQVIETIQPQVSQVASYMPQVQTFAPQVTYAQPHVTKVETISAPQMTYAAPASYLPTNQARVIETVASAPTAPAMVTAPASYIPAPQANMVEVAAPAADAGASVIVEQVGDWQVCEDAQGIFYHHVPTQQSLDNAPQEFLALFPGGYTPPALGAFAAAGYGAAAPQPAGVQVVGAAPTVVEAYAQQAQMIGQPQFIQAAPAMVQQQMQPMMAKVLN